SRACLPCPGALSPAEAAAASRLLHPQSLGRLARRVDVAARAVDSARGAVAVAPCRGGTADLARLSLRWLSATGINRREAQVGKGGMIPGESELFPSPTPGPALR